MEINIYEEYQSNNSIGLLSHYKWKLYFFYCSFFKWNKTSLQKRFEGNEMSLNMNRQGLLAEMENGLAPVPLTSVHLEVKNLFLVHLYYFWPQGKLVDGIAEVSVVHHIILKRTIISDNLTIIHGWTSRSLKKYSQCFSFMCLTKVCCHVAW